jgi:signal transduction histidine kinase
LRSPLSLVTGFSQAVLADIDNMDRESISKYLGFINDSTGRVFKIVDDLLDLTKIELGQVTLNVEAVDVISLLKTHADDYAHVASKKNLTLREVFSSDSLTCYCDAIKTGQVVSNFIDNAIKYSGPGSTIEIIGKQNNDMIWIGIKDEGPGIKPEEVQHLFKGFSHKNISSLPTAGEKSSGLGLAICKRIIEAHGGKIGAESTPDQGSTFWFSLPVKGIAPDRS